MQENLLPILGILGNILLLTAYIPQISKMLRTKKAGDISIISWIFWFLGDSCFLVYSLIEKDWYSAVLFTGFNIGNLILITLTHRYRKLTKKL